MSDEPTTTAPADETTVDAGADAGTAATPVDAADTHDGGEAAASAIAGDTTAAAANIDADADADAATDGPAGEPAAELATADWIRHVPGRHLKAAAKFKSFADFVAGYADLESRLGQALFPPGADAGPETVARFHERLGRPKTPDGYGAPAVPDGVTLDDDKLDQFRTKAFEIGLPQAQFQALVRWEVESQQVLQGEAERQHRQAHRALQAEWGEAAAGNYEKARRVANILFGPEERSALQLSERSEDWAAPLVAALARVSPSFEDHKFLVRGERDLGKSDDALVAELNELMTAADYWQDEAKQRRTREINEALYGTRSVHPAA